MGGSGREWEDVFDGIPIADQEDRRRRLVWLIQGTTYTRDEIEDLVLDLEDPRIQFTQDELDDLEMKARISQRRPVDNYAPTQSQISAWIRSFVDL